ncbi:MAG: sugar transferase [Cellulomonadaceae bacterium]|jgi:exopolysaccharide biosynthesis polyprenyl glycosylphosphotransferase|nr:sugar transferase [Cellulomonadaceae bacterium]
MAIGFAPSTIGRTVEHSVAREPAPVTQAIAVARARAAARPWAKHVRRRVALMDAIAIYVAIFAAFWARLGVAEWRDMDPRRLTDHYAVTSLALLVVWLIALRLVDTRDITIMGAGAAEYSRVVQTTFAVFGLLAIFAYLSRWPIGRSYVAVALPLGLLVLLVGRHLMRGVLVRERERGLHCARTLIVGCPDSARHVIAELRKASQAGFIIAAACLTDEADVGDVGTDVGVPIVGTVADAADYVAAKRLDTVIVTGSDLVTPDVLKHLAWDLEPLGAELIVAPGLADVSCARVRTRPVPGLPLMQVQPPGYSTAQQRVKRVFDVVVGGGLVGLFALPLAVTAVAIKVTSPGPVLFKQQRVGVDGRPFQVLKFRSMVDGADARWSEVMGGEIGLLNKVANDSRITPVGKFIRRWSIDELPQLFNVLAGHMSLVGPRPALEREVDLYDDDLRRRLLVKQGMTGLWQVSGRSNLSVEESMRLDLFYIENWSLTEDLLILTRTAKAVLTKDGAY